jgi:hypothetical protein
VAGDGQAQAGAAKAPCGRDIGLLEGIEQLRLLLGRNADAGVAHLEAHQQLAGRRAGQQAGAQHPSRAR